MTTTWVTTTWGPGTTWPPPAISTDGLTASVDGSGGIYMAVSSAGYSSGTIGARFLASNINNGSQSAVGIVQNNYSNTTGLTQNDAVQGASYRIDQNQIQAAGNGSLETYLAAWNNGIVETECVLNLDAGLWWVRLVPPGGGCPGPWNANEAAYIDDSSTATAAATGGIPVGTLAHPIYWAAGWYNPAAGQIAAQFDLLPANFTRPTITSITATTPGGALSVTWTNAVGDVTGLEYSLDGGAWTAFASGAVSGTGGTAVGSTAGFTTSDVHTLSIRDSASPLSNSRKTVFICGDATQVPAYFQKGASNEVGGKNGFLLDNTRRAAAFMGQYAQLQGVNPQSNSNRYYVEFYANGDTGGNVAFGVLSTSTTANMEHEAIQNSGAGAAVLRTDGSVLINGTQVGTISGVYGNYGGTFCMDFRQDTAEIGFGFNNGALTYYSLGSLAGPFALCMASQIPYTPATFQCGLRSTEFLNAIPTGSQIWPASGAGSSISPSIYPGPVSTDPFRVFDDFTRYTTVSDLERYWYFQGGDNARLPDGLFGLGELSIGFSGCPAHFGAQVTLQYDPSFRIRGGFLIGIGQYANSWSDAAAAGVPLIGLNLTGEGELYLYAHDGISSGATQSVAFDNLGLYVAEVTFEALVTDDDTGYVTASLNGTTLSITNFNFHGTLPGGLQAGGSNVYDAGPGHVIKMREVSVYPLSSAGAQQPFFLIGYL